MLKTKKSKYIEITNNQYINDIDKHFTVYEKQPKDDYNHTEDISISKKYELKEIKIDTINYCNLIIEFKQQHTTYLNSIHMHKEIQVRQDNHYTDKNEILIKSNRTNNTYDRYDKRLLFFSIDMNYIDSFIELITRETGFRKSDLIVYKIVN